jgi:hypothetical protein
MSDKNNQQLITYLSQEIYQRLKVFASLREISESEAIAQILADRLNAQYLSPPLVRGVGGDLSSISDDDLETIEDEPDEILWDFLEPQRDCYDPEAIDEPDEVLMEFWQE